MAPTLARIPYTTPFPPPTIHPSNATTLPNAIIALINFLTARKERNSTLVITGAGISVASGLADYRGENGTYRINRQYRPIFFTDFISSHESRKRYWARSFLGWTVMQRARPNRCHRGIAQLGELGYISGIITQNVDSLHHLSHPHFQKSVHKPPTYHDIVKPETSRETNNPVQNLNPPIVELHGTLRHVTCLTCRSLLSREKFQTMLSRLNPAWDNFLRQQAFSASHPQEGGMRTNPDGDVDVPGAPYTQFRYPPCPKCLDEGGVEVDKDAAHSPEKVCTRGVLKPSMIFFGENIADNSRDHADRLVQEAGSILVLGSSLATYSAYRLVREAARTGKGIGVINLGGIRGEAEFFNDVSSARLLRLRIELPAAEVIGGALEALPGQKLIHEESLAKIDLSGGIGLGG